MNYQAMILDLIRYSLKQNLSMGETNLKEDFRQHIEVYCDLFEAYCTKLKHSMVGHVNYQAILETEKELKEYRERIHDKNVRLLSQGYKHADLIDALDGIYSIIMNSDNYLSNLFAEEWVATDLTRQYCGEHLAQWEAIVCCVDSLRLDGLYKSMRNNVSCSLVSSQNNKFYNGRKIGLLYNVMHLNQCEALAMYNGDLMVSLPDDSAVPLSEYLKTFYKEIGTNEFHCWPHRELETTKCYPFCLPNPDDYEVNKFFHKVLPLFIMRETLHSDPCAGQVNNEIVILGEQKPYGALVHREDLGSVKSQLVAMKTLDPAFEIYVIDEKLCKLDTLE